ncbi:MAG: HypC/HybG/HupF family hydrogenase formation chaperone [Planctomycetes bacterium]|nr:HypC/HybG/HupF family hydrogenase formation chaperone [Planctomycetota bacterium]
MCLAIPMRLVERREFVGTGEVDGVRREIGLALCSEARVGDFVLVHAGFAIGCIDEEAARETLAALARIAAEDGP